MIYHLSQVSISDSLDEPPCPSEVEKAIKSIPSGKSPGSNAIPAEIYAANGPQLFAKLTKLFQAMWNQKKISQELKDTSIIHLYKRKGNQQACDNCLGTSLSKAIEYPGQNPV